MRLGVLTAPFRRVALPRTCFKRYPAAYIIHSSIDATWIAQRICRVARGQSAK